MQLLKDFTIPTMYRLTLFYYKTCSVKMVPVERKNACANASKIAHSKTASFQTELSQISVYEYKCFLGLNLKLPQVYFIFFLLIISLL